MHPSQLVLLRLNSVSGPGFLHLDRLQRDLNLALPDLAAALSDLGDRIAYTGPNGLYVRATGK
jgi:hypothetical protein